MIPFPKKVQGVTNDPLILCLFFQRGKEEEEEEEEEERIPNRFLHIG